MDSEHIPVYNYSPEDRRAIEALPVPRWVSSSSHHSQPVPHKTVHIEGELTIKECRALMRGIKHTLARRADITLRHESNGRLLKTTIE